jgi:hypothetical protein
MEVKNKQFDFHSNQRRYAPIITSELHSEDIALVEQK